MAQNVTVTAGMARAMGRGTRIKRNCPACGLTVPRYPGRYPKHCPSCGRALRLVRTEGLLYTEEPHPSDRWWLTKVGFTSHSDHERVLQWFRTMDAGDPDWGVVPGARRETVEGILYRTSSPSVAYYETRRLLRNLGIREAVMSPTSELNTLVEYAMDGSRPYQRAFYTQTAQPHMAPPERLTGGLHFFVVGPKDRIPSDETARVIQSAENLQRGLAQRIQSVKAWHRAHPHLGHHKGLGVFGARRTNESLSRAFADGDPYHTGAIKLWALDTAGKVELCASACATRTFVEAHSDAITGAAFSNSTELVLCVFDHLLSQEQVSAVGAALFDSHEGLELRVVEDRPNFSMLDFERALAEVIKGEPVLPINDTAYLLPDDRVVWFSRRQRVIRECTLDDLDLATPDTAQRALVEYNGTQYLTNLLTSSASLDELAMTDTACEWKVTTHTKRGKGAVDPSMYAEVQRRVKAVSDVESVSMTTVGERTRIDIYGQSRSFSDQSKSIDRVKKELNAYSFVTESEGGIDEVKIQSMRFAEFEFEVFVTPRDAEGVTVDDIYSALQKAKGISHLKMLGPSTVLVVVGAKNDQDAKRALEAALKQARLKVESVTVGDGRQLDEITHGPHGQYAGRKGKTPGGYSYSARALFDVMIAELMKKRRMPQKRAIAAAFREARRRKLKVPAPRSSVRDSVVWFEPPLPDQHGALRRVTYPATLQEYATGAAGMTNVALAGEERKTIDDDFDYIVRRLLVTSRLSALQDVEFSEDNAAIYLFLDPTLVREEVDMLLSDIIGEKNAALVASPDKSLPGEVATSDWWVLYIPRMEQAKPYATFWDETATPSTPVPVVTGEPPAGEDAPQGDGMPVNALNALPS